MAIADTANTANTQTCTYGYDDLERLNSANCGSLWSQTFQYDAFGNIWQYGNSIFDPGYGSGNHVTGFGYDGGTGYNNGAGNITNDGSNTYTYNAEGRPATVSSTTAVYDAFTRLVEIQGSSGDHTQMVYAPDGFKFAYMNGQTVEKYIAPLAAGLQAVYLAATPAAPAFWRHSDWLGTVRLDSTPAQGVYFDGGWAPFGEYYAGTGTSDRVFTGQRQDVVGGIWDFMFRQYSPTQGRWMVPDPAGLGAVDITNPQTWNRYAYVMNNPLSNIDPLGLLYAVLPPPDFSGIWGLDCGGIFCDFNWFYPIYNSFPGLGGGVHPKPKPKPPAANNGTTSNCVISNGKVTGVATGAGQAPGPGAFGFVPPAGSVAIDPYSLGLVRGSQANAVLGPNASQITFSFDPAPNVPSGFPTTQTLGSILDSGASVGGVNFHGQYDFDIFGFPSLSTAYAVTENAQVTITYPSSLPVNCGGPLADPPLAGPVSPEPVAAIALRP